MADKMCNLPVMLYKKRLMELHNIKNVTINGKSYGFVTAYKEDETLRKSLTGLSNAIFDFSLEVLYRDGYWNDNYRPYSLLDGDRMVANVSVNVLDFCLMGNRQCCIQLGSVMTDAQYRGMGLSEFLMKTVIEDWGDRCNLIYLFANDLVLDFYPKFGFVKTTEYQCSAAVSSQQEKPASVRLDMNDPKNRKIVFSMLQHTRNFSKFCPKSSIAPIKFYLGNLMSENVYYLKDLAAVAFARYEGGVLYLDYLLSLWELSLQDVIQALSYKAVTRVVLGFTPADTGPYDILPYREEGSTLFVLEGNEYLFDRHSLMLPILYHA